MSVLSATELYSLNMAEIVYFYVTEDKMVGWHHQLDRQELDQAPGVGDTHGSLVRCSSQGRKESDMTERLNSTECDFYHN